MELMERPLSEIESLNLDRSDSIMAASESVVLPSTASVVYTDVCVVPEHNDEGLQPAILSFQDSIFLKGSCIGLSL